MEHSKLTWEDIIKFEEVAGYGQHIWKHGEQYYLVVDEGGIAEQRVVYELPLELFQLIESGEKNLVELHFRLKNDAWPSNVSQGEIAEVFGAGGGTQIKRTSVSWYEKMGLLKEIK